MSTVIFDSTIAEKVGINAAIIFERIRYFCEDAKNKNDHYKFHEGYFWTYSSSKGWSNMLPFLTQRQIEKAINDLIEHKMIIVGNFNKNKYDRTRWFTNIVDLTNSISPVSKMDIPENVKWKLLNEEMNLTLNVNEFTPEVEPIPNESSNKSSNESKYKTIAQSDKSDMSDTVFFDFESIYKKYPRKEGKSRGLKIFKTQIKTQDDFENITKAIDNYSIYCTKNINDKKFIKHFSTFMSEWRDWIDFQESKEIVLTEEQLNKIYGVE